MQLLAENNQSATSIDKEMRTTKRVKVREFNDILSCFLCHGYMINPVTVDTCVHSYCRSCIAKHLLNDEFCPQCETSDRKPITLLNLKADDILRMFIYKLVPGLYQQEREQILRFSNGSRSSHHKLEDPSDVRDLEYEENFFAPAEPISLSLEYHPVLLTHCSASQVPPIRYLQCPASVKIHHLKRFLCSKYDIDPDNKQIEVEVIYDEEILPNDFSLMDVGYCYNWKRHAPMKFRYRILLYGGTADSQHHNKANESSNVSQDFKTHCAENPKPLSPQSDKNHGCAQNKLFSLTDDSGNFSLPSTNFALKSKASVSHLASIDAHKNTAPYKTTASDVTNVSASAGEALKAPVKVIIARKSSDSKRPSPKRPNSEEITYTVTSDFKNLRSNDIRYSDYAVSSTTNNSNAATKNVQKQDKASEESAAAECAVSKCDIVVSIPSSQIPRSPYSSEERFENVSLAQLKTASKKSPTSTFSEPPSLKTKNVPKLKIELNSLKTKLTIPKPKSANARLENESDSIRVKYRKNSLDDTRPIAGKVDLETYAKNIGLKPIESLAPIESAESKYSPNASPMSSSSSTTSSSNGGHFSLTSSSEISSSSHKKRKKKHSRESKDSNRKRRKLHAEISSQPAEESLKMKVKITASHNHKSQKSDNKRLAAAASSEGKIKLAHAKQDSTASEINKPSIESSLDALYSESLIDNLDLRELNKTLCEESLSINNLMKSNSDTVSKSKTSETTNQADSSSVAATKPNLLPKPIANIKDLKIPSSPPLPPSLFKTTSLAFTTLVAAAAVSTSTSPKTTTATQKIKETCVKPKPSALQSLKSSYPSEVPDKNNTQKNQHFAVPNPPRSISNSHKTLNAPTSIASAMNKQGNGGMQLKRSMSLDESYTAASGTLTKQQKIEQDRIIRKTAYGAFFGNAQINATSSKNHNQLSHKEENKLTTTIGNSFETPFYSPLSTTAYATKDYGKRKTATVTTQPSSSINICKISDTPPFIAQTPSSSGTAPVTARQRPNMPQSQTNLLRFNQQHVTGKPALEIVRITSNQIPADLLPLPPLSPPKGNRLMGPPVSIVKSKKPTPLTLSPTFIKPLPSTTSAATLKSSTPAQKTQNNAYRTSPPALINLRNTVPLVFPKKTSTNSNAKQNEGFTTQSVLLSTATDQPKTSLREFRPASKEGGACITDVLDLSAGKVTTDPTPITSSLEAALNKIKQNISSSCTATGASDNTNANKSNSGAETNSDDLQNLHLLSESATTREKIAIRTQLFEKPKQQQPSLVVRQQNASVRNIPNPSALAFRNQPSSISTPALSSSSIPTTSSPKETTAAAVLIAGEKLPATSATNAAASQSLNTTQATQATRCTKKPTTIDQVAANLNIRAAASAAKAATSDDAAILDATPANADITMENVTTTSLKSNCKNVNESANLKSTLHAPQTPTKPIIGAADNDKISITTLPGVSTLETKQQLHLPINTVANLSTVTKAASTV